PHPPRATGRPTRPGAGGAAGFTVLYDAGCPLCRAARRWLAARDQLVPLDFVPAGSAAARRAFPGLEHDATLFQLTVVARTGEVYVGDGAWLACLWALAGYRGLAERLATPRLLPVARRLIRAASAVRERTRRPADPAGDEGYRGGDEQAQCTDDRCR
ncbi:MAG TPA: DCC1-like thiol-disulfide oxidoreductase family protein, partial [Pilimelia sp.]|nr:DCC1-like thiol-disulfide oxidoreductase family protein [Pilimelia sp.]